MLELPMKAMGRESTIYPTFVWDDHAVILVDAGAKNKTLIAGDAMNIIDGQLMGPNKQLLSEKDAETATNSLRKLEAFDIENVIAYHGSLFNDNPNQRIEELNYGN